MAATPKPVRRKVKAHETKVRKSLQKEHVTKHGHVFEAFPKHIAKKKAKKAAKAYKTAF